MAKFDRKAWTKAVKKDTPDHLQDGGQELDFSRRFPMEKTNQALMLGFDPSVKKVGIALYDAAADHVLLKGLMNPNDLEDWVSTRLIPFKDYYHIIARVEIPTIRTAWAAAERQKMAVIRNGGNLVAAEKKAASIIFQSGRCRERAEEFIQILTKYQVDYELLASDDRLSLDKKQFKGMSYPDLLKFFKLRVVGKDGFWQFPTKMSAVGLKGFFTDIPKAGDMDERDALCCLFPEKLYNLMAQ